ncbi:MAG: 50S ribosomal protein L9 [Nitrospiraceae bacterium]|jgi:large subunit ribosomal protein L9|nr:50S ribosomal protein L9 [Nitrospiraceae bacterium]MDO9119400.1 50S ribosomal protein L9 [Nitrospira sp.]MDP3092695.1 50S ribosomal protein L9 [Nitrospira sp.]OQW66032.1 MAG: 50S ribosomal protein L9 [Nitrospira sp. ST-bin5]
MKVILQETMDGVGHLGDLLDVRDGFARNFLLPRKKAVLANSRSIKAFEHVKRVAAEKAKKEKLEIEVHAKNVSAVTLTIEAQVGKDDKMFGSVTSKDLAEALAAQGFTIDRRKIQLAQPIKELGTVTVPIKMPREVTATVTVRVVKKQEQEAAAEA